MLLRTARRYVSLQRRPRGTTSKRRYCCCGLSIIGFTGVCVWIGLALLVIVIHHHRVRFVGMEDVVTTADASLLLFLGRQQEQRLLNDTDYQQQQQQQHITLQQQQESPATRQSHVTMVINAFDSTGRPGYIADPTAVRKIQQQQQQQAKLASQNMLWADVCDLPPGVGEEGPSGAQGLWKIRQGLPPNVISPPPHQQPSNSNNNNHNNNQSFVPRILCLVYTHSGRHDTALRAIVQTWGADCDGFLAISNQTDAALGAVHIWHPGLETYNNMWQKVRHAWMYVHQHYRDDYDWFHIGGDDHYVVVPNLRRYAASLDYANSNNNNNHEPIYMGSSMVDFKVRNRYCGGGAGYTLNRPALQLLSRMLPTCFQNTTTSEEDRCIGRCFLFHHKNVSIWCRNTNDERDEQRYHALDVEFHASYYRARKSPWDFKALKRKHNITTTQIGLKQISTTSISFHLTATMIESRHADRGMRRYHALLYGKCGPDMDDAMARVAMYNATYVKHALQAEYKRNQQEWALQRDKCAEVIQSRDQPQAGRKFRKYCGGGGAKRKHNITTATNNSNTAQR